MVDAVHSALATPAIAASTRVAGVDEAGRGPLAGPVAVAAVILDPDRPIAGLDDSKRLSPRRRDVLFDVILARARACHVVLINHAAIDRLNILQATLLGMRQAVAALMPDVDMAVIDGNCIPEAMPCPARAIVGGDHLHASISAASILAKVTRDRYMIALDRRYPGYGFACHKGYGVPAHLEALARLGPCPEHRHSFAPVRRVMAACQGG